MYHRRQLRLLTAVGRRTRWTLNTYHGAQLTQGLQELQEEQRSFAIVLMSKEIKAWKERLKDIYATLGCPMLGGMTDSKDSITIALWTGAAGQVVPFHSKLAGKGAVAVGRSISGWMSRDDDIVQGQTRGEETLDREEVKVSDLFQGGSQAPLRRPRYSALRNSDRGDEAKEERLEEKVVSPAPHLPSRLQSIDPLSLDSIVYFSDDAPQGLNQALDYHFPDTNKVGFVTSSTPFHTGQAFTFWLDDKIEELGAVGLAIKGIGDGAHTRSAEINYGVMEGVGSPAIVTSAKGNIILQLSEERATERLLRGIAEFTSPSTQAKVQKEDRLFLGFFKTPNDEAPYHFAPIIAGDPGRGTIAVDTEASLKHGDKVQIFYRPEQPVARESHSTHGEQVLSFAVSDPRQPSVSTLTTENGLWHGSKSFGRIKRIQVPSSTLSFKL